MYAGLENTAPPAEKREEPHDIYVHLLSGEVLTLNSVTGLELTDHDIELRRIELPTVRFRRSEVFFTTAVPDDAPPQF